MGTSKGPFLGFDKQDRLIDAKTDWWIVWPVVSRSGPLGTIKWWSHWRKYTFHPNHSTVLDPVCLREIADFCQKQTELHRKGKRTFEGQ